MLSFTATKFCVSAELEETWVDDELAGGAWVDEELTTSELMAAELVAEELAVSELVVVELVVAELTASELVASELASVELELACTEDNSLLDWVSEDKSERKGSLGLFHTGLSVIGSVH